ncbi:MAG: tail fiber domain-containing protein, partial [Pyrinomonadaceae bacterium]
TYQGKLNDNNAAANGTYEMQFTLFGGISENPIGTSTINNVPVSNGIFTVQLAFGSTAFDGNPRFLEIAVRPAGSQNPFTVLAPRQQILSAPYSIRSSSAALADVAADSNKLGGISSSGFIQNSTTQQTTSNFNISGDGTLGGDLSANNVNSNTQYSIGNIAVLRVPGTANTFVGLNAGIMNTTGGNNTFTGSSAGKSNTTGNRNSFFGTSAGANNTTGGSNSFFGILAGASNTTGNNNSFFGDGAGFVNNAGDNSFFGTNAGVSNTTGSANSFFGRAAGGTNTTGGSNSFFGYFSGQANTACCNSFFGTSAGAFNTTGTGNSFFGYIAGAANTTGNNNSYFGFQTGNAGTTGIWNSFFGSLAGQSNTTGSFNSFFGYNAGNANTTAVNNSFFGQGAGFKNTTGQDNTFVGNGSGQNNTTAGNNSFVGSLAGFNNTTGANNTFFGFNAGNVNNGGGANTFIGVNAGIANVGSSNNTFLGANAGNTNLTGSGNTYLGANSDGAALITNAVAIGQNAYAGQSNSLILGSINGVNGATSDTNIGIGTTTPQTKLYVKDNTDASLTVESTSADGAGIRLYNNNGNSSRRWLINSNYTFFLIDQDAPAANRIKLQITSVPAGAGLTNNTSGFFRGEFDIEGGLRVRQLTGTGSNLSSLCVDLTGTLELCSSSIRYKKDLKPYAGGLALLDKLSPVTFRWKTDNVEDLGFVAEEVEKVEPLLASYNREGEIQGVKYDRISAVLVNAVKEQQAQIKDQQEQIKLQQAQIDALKKLVCASNKEADVCREKQQ